MQQQKLQNGYEECPTTTRIQKINGRNYIVISHYAGNKDFKKVLGDLAFRQSCLDIKNKKE